MILAPPKFVENVKCQPVTEEEAFELLKEIIPEMIQVLVEQDGKGLAAPQVGIEKRFFIIRNVDQVIPYFNAKFYKNSDARVQVQESCLTYGKDNYVQTKRWKVIQAHYDTIVDNKLVHKKTVLRGYDAIAYQHEAEHLDSLTIFTR